ncbi:MAG: DUF3106 domain-containing protein [Gallionella sp.]
MNRAVFNIQGFAVCLFLLLGLISFPCSAAAPSWRSLTPTQREALAPMVGQWDILPEIQRNRLLQTAKHFPQMTPEQKQRYHDRIEKWSQLTPEQREIARKRYRAFNKLPAKERDRIRQKLKAEQASKAQQSASGVSSTTQAVGLSPLRPPQHSNPKQQE